MPGDGATGTGNRKQTPGMPGDEATGTGIRGTGNGRTEGRRDGGTEGRRGGKRLPMAGVGIRGQGPAKLANKKASIAVCGAREMPILRTPRLHFKWLRRVGNPGKCDTGPQLRQFLRVDLTA